MLLILIFTSVDFSKEKKRVEFLVGFIVFLSGL